MQTYETFFKDFNTLRCIVNGTSTLIEYSLSLVVHAFVIKNAVMINAQVMQVNVNWMKDRINSLLEGWLSTSRSYADITYRPGMEVVGA